MGHAAPAALGVYKPWRPQASPSFRLVQDHFHRPPIHVRETLAV